MYEKLLNVLSAPPVRICAVHHHSPEVITLASVTSGGFPSPLFVIAPRQYSLNWNGLPPQFIKEAILFCIHHKLNDTCVHASRVAWMGAMEKSSTATNKGCLSSDLDCCKSEFRVKIFFLKRYPVTWVLKACTIARCFVHLFKWSWSCLLAALVYFFSAFAWIFPKTETA